MVLLWDIELFDDPLADWITYQQAQQHKIGAGRNSTTNSSSNFQQEYDANTTRKIINEEEEKDAAIGYFQYSKIVHAQIPIQLFVKELMTNTLVMRESSSPSSTDESTSSTRDNNNITNNNEDKDDVDLLLLNSRISGVAIADYVARFLHQHIHDLYHHHQHHDDQHDHQRHQSDHHDLSMIATTASTSSNSSNRNLMIQLKPLLADDTNNSNNHRRNKRSSIHPNSAATTTTTTSTLLPPYMLERTDIWCSGGSTSSGSTSNTTTSATSNGQNEHNCNIDTNNNNNTILHITLRAYVYCNNSNHHIQSSSSNNMYSQQQQQLLLQHHPIQDDSILQRATNIILEKVWCQGHYGNGHHHVNHPMTRSQQSLSSSSPSQIAASKDHDHHSTLIGLWKHVAIAYIQEQIRIQLNKDPKDPSLLLPKSIAFIANGSILPRKSNMNLTPMNSPPAIPFIAPTNQNSTLQQTLHIPIPTILYPYIIACLPIEQQQQQRHQGQTSVLPSTKNVEQTTATNTSTTIKPQYSSHMNHDGTAMTAATTSTSTTIVKLTGLLIPQGVTLIVGGGFHGKSTLLRTIAAGIYNKIPGDGREFCATIPDAVSIRAEDGRYMNQCNISAFISNLPILPTTIVVPPTSTTTSTSTSSTAMDEWMTTNEFMTTNTTNVNEEEMPDPLILKPNTSATTTATRNFSTDEASGSTSQAANVVEAIEMGATAFLVDEDVCAANFMARDGRMRALVMDESITPLLYRVNGLYQTLQISSIVVVGGVGDWLDVPDAVILMDKYQCYDATKKARSISRQFSHGHVQYAGRGVVHRLPWDKANTPQPRRPNIDQNDWIRQLDMAHVAISILDGHNSISIHPLQWNSNFNGISTNNSTTKNNYVLLEDQYMDLSRCEQIVGKRPQLYGCGLAVVWVLLAAQKCPHLGLADLLKELDNTLNQNGMSSLLGTTISDVQTSLNKHHIIPSETWQALVEAIGCAYRPRRFEVGQALTRLRGIVLDELPVPIDEAEETAKLDAEYKKQELLNLWKNRRSKEC